MKTKIRALMATVRAGETPSLSTAATTTNKRAATAKAITLATILLGVALISVSSSQAYAYRDAPTPTYYLNERTCQPSDYLEPMDITNGVDEYLRQNLVGFSIGDYVALEYKGEIFYRYDAFDGVGNRFYIMSDACEQIIGPYYYTSRIDFFE